MKKAIVTSAMLLGVVFLVGCGQKPASQTQPIKNPVPAVKNTTTDQQVYNTALKNYQNQKYSFNLSYPGKYKIKETNWENEPQPNGSIFLVQLGDENVVDFDTDFDKGIMLYIAKIEKNADPLAAPNGMDPTSKKDTIIDGQKARIYNSGEVYAVAKNGYGYLMILGSEANQATKDNFMKIVASFKFNN